jgi:hypothetical protein
MLLAEEQRCGDILSAGRAIFCPPCYMRAAPQVHAPSLITAASHIYLGPSAGPQPTYMQFFFSIAFCKAKDVVHLCCVGPRV